MRAFALMTRRLSTVIEPKVFFVFVFKEFSHGDFEQSGAGRSRGQNQTAEGGVPAVLPVRHKHVRNLFIRESKAFIDSFI